MSAQGSWLKRQQVSWLKRPLTRWTAQDRRIRSHNPLLEPMVVVIRAARVTGRHFVDRRARHASARLTREVRRPEPKLAALNHLIQITAGHVDNAHNIIFPPVD